MRKRKVVAFVVIIFALVGLLFFSSINSKTNGGHLKSKEFKLENFNIINANLPATIYLKQSDKAPGVKIEGSEKIIENMTVEVKRKTLNISFRSKSLFYKMKNSGKVSIWITVNDLKKVSFSGTGDVETENTLVCDNLQVILNGATSARLSLKVKTFEGDINGSGEIITSGNAVSQEIKIIGAGKYNGGEFITDTSKVMISGSGVIYVYAINKLNVTVYGSGKVFYRGKPEIAQKILGSGIVEKN